MSSRKQFVISGMLKFINERREARKQSNFKITDDLNRITVEWINEQRKLKGIPTLLPDDYDLASGIDQHWGKPEEVLMRSKYDTGRGKSRRIKRTRSRRTSRFKSRRK